MEHGVAAATMHDPAARTVTPDDAASCSASTMPTETTPATTAGTPTDAPTVQKAVPTGADRLGIDTEGRIHYWHRAGEQVLVVEPTADLTARIETVDVTPGDEFLGYLDHAKEICGFDSLQYCEDAIGACLGGGR